MKKGVQKLITRYILLIILALLIPLYSFVLLPLKLYPLYGILSLFYEVAISGSSLLISGLEIQITQACIGVSALFLLLLLNISTPGIKLRKRINLFLFSFILFIIFNWMRITFLSVLFVSGSLLFDQIHIFTWYFISTIAVIVIWLVSVKMFNIKKAPFLSDIYYLYKLTKKRSRRG